MVQPGEGLNDIARKFDLGYTALAAANPGVDQFSPGVGRRLIIPALYVLPDAPRRGIVINLAQYRMFYFPPGGDRVETYPLGLGVIGKKTPLGATSVVRKEPNPTWYPPPSIRAERPELPPMIPPRPEQSARQLCAAPRLEELPDPRHQQAGRGRAERQPRLHPYVPRGYRAAVR